MLNVHFNPISSNSQKVTFFLEETGIPYKGHAVDLRKGEQLTDAFLKVNPFGAVPAIEHDGFRMAESLSILRYLAQRFQKTSFYPENLEERARIDQVADFTSIHIGRWTAGLNWNLVILPMIGQTPNAALVEECRSNLARFLPRLERYLANSSATTYLCGANLTIADCAFVPACATFARVGVSLTDFPLTSNYVQRVTERPAWKKVVADAMKAMGK